MNFNELEPVRAGLCLFTELRLNIHFLGQPTPYPPRQLVPLLLIAPLQ